MTGMIEGGWAAVAAAEAADAARKFTQVKDNP